MLKKVFEKIAVPFLLIIVTLLAVRFLMWNHWQIDRAIKMVKAVSNAPAAVNLMLSRDKKTLFRTSFPFNSGGNYYLVNLFDISPYIKETISQNKIRRRLDLTLTVNNQALRPVLLHISGAYNILRAGKMTFVFTTPGCDIHCLIRLRESLPELISRLNQARRETKTIEPESYGQKQRLVKNR